MGCCSFYQHATFQIVLFSLGLIAGLVALFVFPTVMHNISAGLLGGASALYAGYLVFDIVKMHNIEENSKRILDMVNENHIKLIVEMVMAVIGVSGSLVAITFFIFRGVSSGEKSGGPSFLSAIQAWMLFKWSLSFLVHLIRHHSGPWSSSSAASYQPTRPLASPAIHSSSLSHNTTNYRPLRENGDRSMEDP